jgi:hypothetical protein
MATDGLIGMNSIDHRDLTNRIRTFSETIDERGTINGGILLANSDALKCRLACRLFEGIQALKPPLQKPQLCGGE